MSISAIPSELLPARELAARLGIAENTVRLWVRTGRIPAPIRISRRCVRHDYAAVIQALGVIASDNGKAA